MVNKIEKFFRLQNGKGRARIKKVKDLIMARCFDQLDVKKMQGHANLYRVRSGDFRFIYFDDGSEIRMVDICRRDEGTYRDY